VRVRADLSAHFRMQAGLYEPHLCAGTDRDGRDGACCAGWIREVINVVVKRRCFEGVGNELGVVGTFTVNVGVEATHDDKQARSTSCQ
jgi:hypothetical protein